MHFLKVWSYCWKEKLSWSHYFPGRPQFWLFLYAHWTLGYLGSTPSLLLCSSMSPSVTFNIYQEVEYLFLQGVIKASLSLWDSPGWSLALYTLASFVSCCYRFATFVVSVFPYWFSLESLGMFHRSVMENTCGKCSSLEHSLKSNLRQTKLIEVRKHTEQVYHKLHVLGGAESGWQSHLDRSPMFMRELQFRLWYFQCVYPQCHRQILWRVMRIQYIWLVCSYETLVNSGPILW